jgi:hypothetical protein
MGTNYASFHGHCADVKSLKRMCFKGVIQNLNSSTDI